MRWTLAGLTPQGSSVVLSVSGCFSKESGEGRERERLTGSAEDPIGPLGSLQAECHTPCGVCKGLFVLSALVCPGNARAAVGGRL